MQKYFFIADERVLRDLREGRRRLNLITDPLNAYAAVVSAEGMVLGQLLNPEKYVIGRAREAGRGNNLTSHMAHFRPKKLEMEDIRVLQTAESFREFLEQTGCSEEYTSEEMELAERRVTSAKKRYKEGIGRII